MGGGGSPSGLVSPGEMVWRLIDDQWYQPSASGKLAVQEAAFIGQVSLVRESMVSQQIVDAVKSGKFAKYGIARLAAGEIRKVTGGDVRVDPDKDWPPDAHVLFIRKSGGKNLQLTHSEERDLTNLANQVPLLRVPKP